MARKTKEKYRQVEMAQPEPPKEEPPVISVDKDGIITVHQKAAVWPYDKDNTAVQVNTPYGYILVLVQRYDR